MRPEYGAGFVTSMLVFAVGAVLYWGITTTQTHGFRLSTIGVILMIVGAVGFVMTLVLSVASGVRRRSTFDQQAIDNSGRRSVVHEELR
ncbi:MAG TPA: hypothetical protein VG412_04045 [Acidimicrobiales bacterium]|nr:hypothetical protein [Acidimicrobiales bacterium]